MKSTSLSKKNLSSNANGTLAIVLPYIGARSETFIRRHTQELLPEKTVAITAEIGDLETRDWSANCPVIVKNWIPEMPLSGRILQLYAYKNKVSKQLFHWQEREPSWSDIKKFLQQHQVKVILAEYLDKSLPWVKVARDLKIPLFAHAHGYDISYRLRFPQWRRKYLIYNHTGGIITMSQASKKFLVEIGLQPDKIYVVPYGIDCPAEPIKRTERNIIKCLAVGRMVGKKAPLKTLEAFRQAAEVCPNLYLDYIGAGELLPTAQKFVETFNLSNKVTLHGSQPNEVVQDSMKKADIFMQHSITDSKGDKEGLPVAILEAMSNSLPVVSTRHAGIPEAVLEGTTGYLVDEGDIEGMAEKLLMLARDHQNRCYMGEAGWLRVKENFSWEKERSDLLRIFKLD